MMTVKLLVGAPQGRERDKPNLRRLGPVDSYLSHRTMAARVTTAR